MVVVYEPELSTEVRHQYTRHGRRCFRFHRDQVFYHWKWRYLKSMLPIDSPDVCGIVKGYTVSMVEQSKAYVFVCNRCRYNATARDKAD